MLINCTRCGKTLSSKIKNCPFCRKETGEILNAIAVTPVKKKSRLRTGIFSLIPRKF